MAYKYRYRSVFMGVSIFLIYSAYIGYKLTGTLQGSLGVIATAYVLVYVAIVAHELGHAIGGLAGGMKVPVISFGGGMQVKVLRAPQRFYMFGLLPSEGLTVFAPKSADKFRRRMFVAILAGPLANFIVAMPAAYLLWWSGVEMSEMAAIAAKIWVAVNVFFFVMNLLPMTDSTAIGPIKSDGAQLLGLFKMTDEEVEQLIVTEDYTLALVEFSFGSVERSVEIIVPHLEHSDIPLELQISATAMLADAGHHDRALVLCERALASEPSDIERAILENNLAFILLEKERQEDLARADELSASAFEYAPMLLAIRATRGAVLLRQEKYSEAIVLLDDKRYKLERKLVQCHVLCDLAEAYVGTGNIDGARRALDSAKRLDPENEKLELTNEKLRGAVEASAT